MGKEILEKVLTERSVVTSPGLCGCPWSATEFPSESWPTRRGENSLHVTLTDSPLRSSLIQGPECSDPSSFAKGGK